MSVKIEILDYQYGDGINMLDCNEGNGAGFTVNSESSVSWAGGYNSVNYFSNPSTQSLIIGKTYKVSFKVSNYTGAGDVGWSTSSGVPNIQGVTRFSSNSNGVKTFEFIATGTSFPDLFGRNTNTATIKALSVQEAQVVDWENSVVGELDVTDHSDFPLALTFQISDFRDLTSTSGDYSKTFKIPATKNNNNIFKHIYIPNSITNNKVTDKKSCRVLFNNLYSLVGLIQVDGVGGYGEKPSYYNCVFFGSNLNWANDVQDALLSSLEWGSNGEDLTYNKNSITATWQHLDCDNPSNSPIVYPITSYGELNSEGEPRTIQLLDTKYDALGTGSSSVLGYAGFFNNGDNYNTPAPVSDWRPAVFIKPTLDKIFSQVKDQSGSAGGYTISSSFMNTDMFKKLVWLLPNFEYNNSDQQTLDFSARSNFLNNFYMSATGAGSSMADQGVQKLVEGDISQDDGNDFYTGANSTELKLFTFLFPSGFDFNFKINLDDGHFDLTNNEVIIGEFGNYIIELKGLKTRIANVYKGGGDQVQIDKIDTILFIEVNTLGQTSYNIIGQAENTHTINADVNQSQARSTGYINLPDINTGSIYLNKGDKVRLRIGTRVFSAQRNWQPFLVKIFYKANTGSKFNIEIDPFTVTYGQTYSLKNVINNTYKQIDFIKGVAHAFNLQMITDESTRTIFIEPFDSFYKPYGKAIDWTYKLDRSDITSDKWLETDLKRNLVFKYKSDGSDKKVESRSPLFDDIKDEYPYREELPSTFKKGNSTFENPFFAGTYNAKDKDTSGASNDADIAYSGCLWTEDVSSNSSTRPDKGFNFLPRLLFWNKYSPASSVGQKFAEVQTWSSITQFLIADASETSYLSNILPQATMLNRDSTTSPNLAYGNAWVRDYDDATGVYTQYRSGSGLYNAYYRNMFEGLKKSPRLRTVNIHLSITDIVNIDFSKLIYIDGVYWRLNRIIDFQPNKNISTKVELLEWFEVGVFAATAPMIGQGGGNSWLSAYGSLETAYDNSNDMGA